MKTRRQATILDLINEYSIETQEELLTRLKEKGYNPVNQIVGYIMSGDPSYITSNNSARSIIVKVERDELLEVLVESYIEKNFNDNK